MKQRLLTAAALMMLAVPTSANAAEIFRSITLVGTNFEPFRNAAPAEIFDPLTISFSVRFDNSLDISNSTEGLTVFANTAGGPLQYAYNPITDLFAIGTDPSTRNERNPGRIGCSLPSGSTCAFIGNFSTTPEALRMIQSPESVGSYFTEDIQLTVGGAVPEPATWAFMILGFGLIGASMRKSRRGQLTVTYI